MNQNGDVVTTIDTNADSINFDNSNNNFTSDNVQDALEELQDSLQGGNVGVELVDNNDGTITLINDDGVDLGTVDKADLTDNGNGEYVFDNGSGNPVTIDVAGDVVDNIINNGDIYDEIIDILENQTDSLVDNGDGTFTHTAADGTVVTFDANTTDFTNNGDGSFTFTNQDGDEITVDVPGEVVNNFNSIVNGGPVTVDGDTYNSVEEYFQDFVETNETLTVLQDNGDGTFTYTDEDGNDVTFDANTLNIQETTDGVYEFTDEDGTLVTTIDTNADNINFDNTNNNFASDNVQDALEELQDSLQGGNIGVELVDNNDGTITLLNEDGVDLGTVEKADLTDNGNGEYEFDNGSGNPITIDVAGDVVDNIINNGDIYDEIIDILENQTDSLVDNGDGTFTHTAADGTEVDFDANTTDFTNNGDGSFTFTNDDGDEITVDVPGEVVNNFNSIVNGGPVTVDGDTYNSVEEYFQDFVETNETLTVLDNNGDGTFTYTDEDGNDVTFDANTLNVEETSDGVYEFTDEEGTLVTTIDTNADNINFDNTNNNFTSDNVQDALEELQDSLQGGNVGVELVDNNDGTITLLNEDGVDLGTVEKADLTDNGNGEYEFDNGSGNPITIDVAGDVVDNIINNGDIYDEIIDILENQTDSLVDNGDGTFTHTAADGTEVTFDANTTDFQDNGDGTYTFTNDNGDAMTIDTNADNINFDNTNNNFASDNVQDALEELQDSLQGGNIGVELVDNNDGTITLLNEDGVDLGTVDKADLTDNGNGEYEFDNGSGNPVTIDVAGDVVDNITNNGDIYDEIIDILENQTDSLVDNGDGTFTHTAADGTEVMFNANTTDFTNNGDGSFTFTNDNGDQMTVDVPGEVVNNFNSIVNGGPVTVNGDTYNSVEEYFQDFVETNETLTVLQDNGDGTFTYTDEDGNDVTFDANTLNIEETTDGVYEFTDEDGTLVTTIDTNADNINFDNTNNNFASDNVQDALEELQDSLQGGNIGVELVDNNDGTITLLNEDGVDLGTVDKADLTDNGNGEYEFDNGSGNPVTIDVAGDVVDNITNNGDIYDEIIDILENQTDSLVDNGDGTFTHTAADGTEVMFDANTTDFQDNGDGTYTFTNDNGDAMTIDTNADNINFDNTNNNFTSDNVQDALEELQDSLQGGNVGVELVDNNDGTITLLNEDGVDLGTVEKADLTDNGNGEYEFDNGSGNPVTIDVAGDVVDNIINNGDIYDEIIDILENQTDSLVDNGDGTFTHTAADGTEVTFDANTTDFTNNGDGSFTFTNDDGDEITVDVPGEVVNNFNSIVNGGPVTVDGDTYNSVEEYFQDFVEINETLTVLDDNGDGTFTYTDEDGNDVTFDANTLNIEETTDGVYKFTDEDGTLVTTIDTNADQINFDNTNNNFASDNVQDALEELQDSLQGGNVGVELVDNNDGSIKLENEDGDDLGTINKADLTDNTDGSYTFTNNDGSDVTFDVKTVDVSFNATSNEYEFKDADGNVIATIDMNANNVAFDDTNANLGADNVQDALEELAAESDSLVDNGDGTYTHTAVDGTVETIDANTTSVSETDGVYTFKDGKGDVITTIDTNADAIAFDDTNSNLGADNVQDAIDTLVDANQSGAGITLEDNGDGTVTLKSENGDDLGTIDKAELTDNNDGTYTFNNTGNPADDVVIDVPASVINQFDEIVNGGSVDVDGDTYTTVEEYFKNLIEANETLTELTYDSDKNQLNFKDEDEVLHNIQLNNTSLTYDETNQNIVYLDSEGNTSTIDLNNLVNSNINSGDLKTDLEQRLDIVNGEDALLHDVQIDVNEANLKLQNIGGTLQVEQIQNGQSGQILVTNQGGNGANWADPISIAKGDITSNDIDVTNGENAVFKDVNLEVKDGAITTSKLDDAAVTPNKIGSGGNDKVMITDGSGNVAWIDQVNMVSDNETLTVLSDNNDGTFTYTDEEGDDITFDANTTSVTEVDGVFTFTDSKGNVITEIDTNAKSLNFDNTTNNFASDNVQDALEELQDSLQGGNIGVELVDNNDGSIKLENEDGDDLGTINKADLTDNTDGSYTFTNNDGSDVTFDVKTVDVSFNATSNEYEFKDADGTVIATIDMNADNVAFDDANANLGADNVQDALEELAAESDSLVDKGDGTYKHTAVDGTVETIDANTTSVSESGGVYTFKDGNGDVITTIDTNADSLNFDNTTNNFTSDNVQDALEELADDLDSGAGVEMKDNQDGSFELFADDGTSLGQVAKADLTDNTDGSYTFTNNDGSDVTFDVKTVDVSFNATSNEYEFKDADGTVIATIDMNADNVAFDDTNANLGADNVQDALEELAAESDSLVDNGDGTYKHTAVDGTVETIDANTTSVSESGGVYTFKDGNDVVITTIDTNADSINFDNSNNNFTSDNVQDALEELQDSLQGGNVGVELIDNNDGTITLLNQDGVDLGTVDKGNLTDSGSGTYTFNNTGNPADDVVIDVIGDVVDNITNNGDIYNEITNILETKTDSLVDNGDGTFTHTAADGEEVTFDANTTDFTNNGGGSFTFTNDNGDTMEINVSSLETLTKIVENTDGTFTFTDEDGTETVVDVGNLETLTSLALNADGKTLEYTDEDGTVSTVDLEAVIQNFESVSSLVDNGDGTFTYTDEDGSTTGIDVSSLETLTAIALNPDNTNIDYTDEDGNVTQLDMTKIVNNLETITTVVENADGTFTFTDEDGTETVVDVGDLETLTSLALNADGKTLEYTDEDGVVTSIDLETVIDDFETVTTVVENTDGTFTFTDEDGTETVVDVGNLETLTSLALNADGKTLEYTDEDGTLSTVDLEAVIQNFESVSSLVDNGDGTFTYTDEEGNTTTLDVSNSETLTTIALNPDNTNIDYTDEDGNVTQLDMTKIVNNLETLTTVVENTDGTFTFTDEDGGQTVVDVSNLETLTSIALNADNTNIDYTDEEGNVTQLNMTQIVENLETTSTMVDNGDGTFTYTDEENNITEMKAAMPKFFYMPSVIMPTEGSQVSDVNAKYDNTPYAESGGTYTVDLYALYKEQYGLTGSHSVSSDAQNSDLPVLDKSELIYNITWFDSDVFDNVSLNDNGELTYTIKSSATINVGTFMNIVFEVK